VQGRGVVEQNVTFADIAAAWASGATFVSVMEMTDKFEGSVVRGLRRLAELLTQLTDAMHAIGDMELKAKFEKVISAVISFTVVPRRHVHVFAGTRVNNEVQL
jgi:superfamily II RNA helicase